MKKHILKIGWIFIIFAAAFFACQQELFEKEGTEPALTVKEAQAWFESSQPEFLLLKSGNKEKKTKVAKPEWKGAFATKNDNFEIVETHIVTNGGFGFATESAYDQWKTTNNPGYMTSLTRLVVMKYKKSGEMVSFLMTIVGDKEYLETKQFKMWGNTYLTKEKDFSGLVLFHSPAGEFVNGWRFTNGKVTHTVNVNFENGFGVSLKSGNYNCSSYPVYGWFQDCTDYYTIGEVDGQVTSINYTGTSCGTPYMDFMGERIECTYVGGSSGGYNPPNNNNNIITPCTQVQNLANSSVFQSKMQDLNNKTTEIYEAAYIMRNGEYHYVQGSDYMFEMSLPINNMNPADGYLHSHPSGTLSIFSASDIKAIYDGWVTLGINNLETFTAGVVTASGTTYILKVENKTTFMNFASANLKYQNNFDAFEGWYLLYGITPENSEVTVETGFMQLINNQFNTGLKLFKGNVQNFSQWNLRDYQQGILINTNCNN
jgi:hypothetical protein